MSHTTPIHEVLNKLTIDMASPITKPRRIFFLLVSFQYCAQSFKQATQLDISISRSIADSNTYQTCYALHVSIQK